MQVTLKKEREAANAVARKIAQQEDGIGPFIQTEQEESNTKELRRLERLKIAEYQVQQANLKLSKEDEEKQVSLGLHPLFIKLILLTEL